MTCKPDQLGGYSLLSVMMGCGRLFGMQKEEAPAGSLAGRSPPVKRIESMWSPTGLLEGIAVNGRNLNTTTDTSYLHTTSIALVVDSGNASGDATFSSLLYTLLP